MDRILPRPTELSAPYWEGCRNGKLRLQYCQACERHQFYPRSLCSQCLGDTLEWRDASGYGRIASFTVIHRGLTPAYPAPYVVALIDLEEGPRMMSNIIDAEATDISVGDEVTVAFAAWSEEIDLPVFRIAAR